MSLSEILKMSMKQQSPVIVKETILKEQPNEVKSNDVIKNETKPEVKQQVKQQEKQQVKQQVKQQEKQQEKQQPVVLQPLPPVIIKEGRGKNQKEIVVPEDENI